MHDSQYGMQSAHEFVLSTYSSSSQTAVVSQRPTGSLRVSPEAQTQAKFESSTKVDAHAEHLPFINSQAVQ